MTDKAPGLHAELQRQLAEQQAAQDAARAAQMGSMGGAAKAPSGEDFWYDVGGWVCFAGIALSWVVMLTRQNAAA